MAKRKYTRFGDEPAAFECTNRKCKWQGLLKEKIDVLISESFTEKACPHCGNNEFYGLLEIPTKTVL